MRKFVCSNVAPLILLLASEKFGPLILENLRQFGAENANKIFCGANAPQQFNLNVNGDRLNRETPECFSPLGLKPFFILFIYLFFVKRVGHRARKKHEFLKQFFLSKSPRSLRFDRRCAKINQGNVGAKSAWSTSTFQFRKNLRLKLRAGHLHNSYLVKQSASTTYRKHWCEQWELSR